MQQLNILDEMQDNQVVEDLEELELENNGWETYRLADACTKIGSGATPTGGKEAYLQDGPISLIRSQNILDFSFSYDGLAYINEEQAKKLDNVKIEERDILLNITGDSVARVCQVPKQTLPARVNQHVAIIRPNKEKLNPEYLKYHLLNPQYKNFMLGLSSSGATRNALTKVMIENFVITCPKIIEQEKIAKILSSLDDKIELNQKMNKTLEEMAQAIFKHWFIDFEFPNEEGKPYKSSGGEMVDSELGEIPKGWEINKVSELFDINIGRTPPREEKHWFSHNENDIPWISIRDLGINGTYVLNTSEYLTQKAINKFNIHVVPNNTVILSFKLTMGKVAITSGEMTTNEAIAHFNITPSSKLTTQFLYCYFKKFDYNSLGSTSSIATAVNSKILKTIPIIVPNGDLLLKFSSISDNIFSNIKNNLLQIKNLTEVRDSLLPKLMSGEIRVNPSPNPEETHP